MLKIWRDGLSLRLELGFLSFLFCLSYHRFEIFPVVVSNQGNFLGQLRRIFIVQCTGLRSMEEELARQSLDDLENEVVDSMEEEDDYALCLVGRVLTDGSVHFS